MHVKSAVKQIHTENVFSSKNTFNHGELKTSSIYCTFSEMCLTLQKGFWCVWFFLCSYKEASTYVQAASDSEKDLTWYLISANVLTNTSASMLSDMVGAISDSGVGTTQSKHMLQFCIKNTKKTFVIQADQLRQRKTM